MKDFLLSLVGELILRLTQAFVALALVACAGAVWFFLWAVSPFVR